MPNENRTFNIAFLKPIRDQLVSLDDVMRHLRNDARAVEDAASRPGLTAQQASAARRAAEVTNAFAVRMLDVATNQQHKIDDTVRVLAREAGVELGFEVSPPMALTFGFLTMTNQTYTAIDGQQYSVSEYHLSPSFGVGVGVGASPGHVAELPPEGTFGEHCVTAGADLGDVPVSVGADICRTHENGIDATAVTVGAGVGVSVLGDLKNVAGVASPDGNGMFVRTVTPILTQEQQNRESEEHPERPTSGDHDGDHLARRPGTT